MHKIKHELHINIITSDCVRLRLRISTLEISLNKFTYIQRSILEQTIPKLELLVHIKPFCSYF